ncbi:SRPBCC family protein [Cyclobacterium marinum]|mgnify:FL=1|uniref:START domain-containing protein n=1 Tax=Cyclobacterium marinum (strain ATCC 25205 / DSM 745 / LMG 13164 / NCIMB 1802) TaxID=880070 RepID=G0J620_CYCMS|nr:hypothetical protein [Cyclobacterium marinum]AEL26083.1 hypothetical protein Cycma_2341 [Cyclobacterium marinum DSM 745]MBR9775398.1 hypothetical protein [Cytophagales bacterium]
MKFILFSISLYIFSSFSIFESRHMPPEFELIKEGNGLSFYERWINMEDGTKSREVKFIISIKAPYENVIEVLTKEKYGMLWNDNTLAYKIKSTGPQSWISYMRYSFPFPLSDRECYLKNRLEEGKESTKIYFNSSNSRIFSEGVEMVQMTGLEGRWIVTKKQGYTLLRYHIISVPEKGLPRWIVDPIIRRNLWNTMQNLKQTIEKI